MQNEYSVHRTIIITACQNTFSFSLFIFCDFIAIFWQPSVCVTVTASPLSHGPLCCRKFCSIDLMSSPANDVLLAAVAYWSCFQVLYYRYRHCYRLCGVKLLFFTLRCHFCEWNKNTVKPVDLCFGGADYANRENWTFEWVIHLVETSSLQQVCAVKRMMSRTWNLLHTVISLLSLSPTLCVQYMTTIVCLSIPLNSFYLWRFLEMGSTIKWTSS